MKKVAVLVVSLCLFSINALSQVPDYSGEWTLDKHASKLFGRMASIESMSITVTQTGNELKIVTFSKRASQPQNASGEEIVTYSLDGKEIKMDINNSSFNGTIRSRVRFEGGKLNLKAERTIRTQLGEFSATTRDIWELSPDGATLKIKRETETPQETMSAEMIFHRQPAVAQAAK